MTFRRFLADHYSADSPIGEFSRAYAAEMPDTYSRTVVLEHLESVGVSRRDLEVFRTAWIRWLGSDGGAR